tara:strand:+ start:350 stop:886 length:537 start_codon:yes stop_codon:yes gene_type:complete
VGIILISYSESIIKSMNLISKKRNSIFIGQSVSYPGNLFYKTLKQITQKKKLEVPVFEETQMGLSIGLALNNFLPISCYPRFDFLLLAFNQLINHLDKIPIISDNKFIPKVIIRVSVGSKKPLDAGEQHTQDYSIQLSKMLKTIKLYKLDSPKKVIDSYQEALECKYSSIMVEYAKYM